MIFAFLCLFLIIFVGFYMFCGRFEVCVVMLFYAFGVCEALYGCLVFIET
jgi:hypothetical protein